MVEALSCQRSISRPLPAVVAPRSARPAVSFCGSSPVNPVKKRSPLDIDWTAMFETGSTKLLETNLSPPALEVILPRQPYPARRGSYRACTRTMKGYLPWCLSQQSER